MIGFYDYTVVLTYISLISSIMGMFCAIDGKLPAKLPEPKRIVQMMRNRLGFR